jgi:6-pyruvoyltetrahydropterin/6-carboxytetrahydropterin synthase
VKVVVEGEVEEKKGYLIDYGEIKKAADPIIQQLDHYYLNKIDGLQNPTAENLARWIYERVKPGLPLLRSVFVYETCTSACEYGGG